MREMKDSGIEWIGDIPADWKTIKSKYCISISNGADPKTEGSTPVYGSGAESFKTCGEYKIGPAVLLGRKGATLHIPHYIEGNYWNVDTAFDATPFCGNINLKFYYYCACVFDYAGYISQTTLPGMTQTNYKNMSMPFPQLEVQERIANFLDEKCSQIDAIIARQQEVIEKLKAYKLSVITEAVTKGLNPDVPMKDSGVEWIGEVPEHWKVCRLKNVLQQIKNAVKVGPFGSQLKTNDYVDAGYWVYTQRTVLDKNFDSNDTFISCEKYRDMEGFKVEADDILITTRGTGTTGHIAKVPPNFFEGILHPCLMRIKLDESICKYDYLFYLFEYAAFIRNQIDFASNTSSLPVLYSYTLNNIWITLPSVNEQLQIATALNEVAAKIDNIIIKRQQVIDSLIDYKKSLIYEVVTGKKEV